MLHGLLAAEPVDQPRIGVAGTPLLDLEQQVTYIEEDIPAFIDDDQEKVELYQSFFAAYFRRIFFP
ncbi:MAG: hypothetical protein KUG82_12770 [Pseudomonadales bacterium]|nr:hypothetical protein [Pseudomonadales bacterium]